jgi:shikimate kinase
MRVYLIGFMGAGKTHLGKLLSKKLGIPFFDLDDLIVNQQGRSINQIFEDEGEEFFRITERDVLRSATEANASMVLSCGGGAPCYFNNIDYMNKHGITVWLDLPSQILLGRLRQDKEKRPLLKDFNDEELRAYIIRKNADRKIYYERAKLRIKDENISINELIKLIPNE